MREIIFVRTRWNYDSYTDFWSLVELSGFPICYTDQIDQNNDAIYIVAPMNGELLGVEKIKDSKAKILLWNLERPSGSDGLENYAKGNHSIKLFDNMLLSDRELVKRCNNMLGDDYFVYTPLGSHPLLGSPGLYSEKMYDVIHLSCYSNHRSRLFVTPSVPKSRLGLHSVAPNGWGDKRHKYLQQSRFMLNIHQDDEKFIEPLRFALAVAYGLPIITETCYDKFPYNFPYVVYIDDIEDIKPLIDEYDRETYEFALVAREYYLELFPFRKCVEDTIRGLYA